MLKQRIFQKDWWLDITAQKKWGKIVYESKYGNVNFVYAHRKRYKFLTQVYVAPLSPYSGIYFELDKEISVAEKYKLLSVAIPEIVTQLPDYFRLIMNFSPDFDWWSPLYWEGFTQHTIYTGILSDIKNHDQIRKGFNQNIKRNIKKAQKEIEVRKGFDAERLYALFKKTMNNQSKNPGYSKEVLLALCKEVEERKCGKVFIGEDKANNAHAALLLVWDSTSAYYLAGGTDPDLRSSGAMPLIMWEAIKYASQYVDKFDFEGSKQKGIERFIRSFGAVPHPFYTIQKGFGVRKVR